MHQATDNRKASSIVLLYSKHKPHAMRISQPCHKTAKLPPRHTNGERNKVCQRSARSAARAWRGANAEHARRASGDSQHPYAPYVDGL